MYFYCCLINSVCMSYYYFIWDASETKYKTYRRRWRALTVWRAANVSRVCHRFRRVLWPWCSLPGLPAWSFPSSVTPLVTHNLATVKPGFHYPSSRPELTGVKKCTRVDGPSWRVCRQLGCIFWHPSTRAVNSGVIKCTRVHGPSTRPVNSGRKLG